MVNTVHVCKPVFSRDCFKASIQVYSLNQSKFSLHILCRITVLYALVPRLFFLFFMSSMFTYIAEFSCLTANGNTKPKRRFQFEIVIDEGSCSCLCYPFLNKCDSSPATHVQWVAMSSIADIRAHALCSIAVLDSPDQ